ncbi:hypothetical protein CI109_105244 [Kwoniella shandongensis]|uniref:Uncharacterized protein n=1 Tax=Kwoniella shandongensis TaxID=1734106 RepID=A0AAJ8LMX8_9TREE
MPLSDHVDHERRLQSDGRETGRPGGNRAATSSSGKIRRKGIPLDVRLVYFYITARTSRVTDSSFSLI